MGITKISGFRTTDGKTHSTYPEAKKWEAYCKFEDELRRLAFTLGMTNSDFPGGDVRKLAMRLYSGGFRFAPSSAERLKITREEP